MDPYKHFRLVGPTRTEAEAIEPTEETEIVDCGLVFKSVGYQSVQLDPDLPFDHVKGLVPNIDGQVVNEEGLFCAGWLATGPRGVIVDTMNEAFKVGHTVLHDLQRRKYGEKEGFEGLARTLSERNVEFLSFDDWEKIDAEEISRGERMGKVREKITDLKSQLSLVKQTDSCDSKEDS